MICAAKKERLQQRAQLAARVAAEQATKAGGDLEDCGVTLGILHPWKLTVRT